jgi:hypothetical protein
VSEPCPPHSRNWNEVAPAYDSASSETQDAGKISEWMDTGQGGQEYTAAETPKTIVPVAWISRIHKCGLGAKRDRLRAG